MALGEMLVWWQCPPAIRKQVRNHVLATLLFSAAGVGFVCFRDSLGIPREPWGRYGPLAIALVPVFVIGPLFLFNRRRIRRRFHEARGRLCTHCAYNLTALSERGTCPECGKAFDAETDKAMWAIAGFERAG